MTTIETGRAARAAEARPLPASEARRARRADGDRFELVNRPRRDDEPRVDKAAAPPGTAQQAVDAANVAGRLGEDLGRAQQAVNAAAAVANPFNAVFAALANTPLGQILGPIFRGIFAAIAATPLGQVWNVVGRGVAANPALQGAQAALANNPPAAGRLVPPVAGVVPPPAAGVVANIVQGQQQQLQGLIPRGAALRAAEPPAVWVDDNVGEVSDEPRRVAELRAGRLAVRMEVGLNEQGDTMMRATFDDDGTVDTTEDNWSDTTLAGTSRFAERFGQAAARLDGAQLHALGQQLGHAREQVGWRQSDLNHEASRQRLSEAVGAERLTLLVSEGRG